MATKKPARIIVKHTKDLAPKKTGSIKGGRVYSK